MHRVVQTLLLGLFNFGPDGCHWPLWLHAAAVLDRDRLHRELGLLGLGVA